jgi:hypothetical protein
MLYGYGIVNNHVPTLRATVMRGGSVPYVPLLDTYTGATSAYSLRKLRTAYSGSCIRVRRSSDSASQDIGFVNNVLDTTSLLSFVGSNDGHVSIFYDQSGNAYNFEQTTLDYQPKIVSAGSLLTKNSKPTVVFDGLSDYMSISSSLSSFSFLHKTGKSFISVVGYNRVANDGFILCNNNETSANIGYSLFTLTTSNVRNFTTNGNSGLATVSNLTVTNPLTTNSLFLINDETDNGNATALNRSKIYVNNGSALSLNVLTNSPSTANATADLTIGSKSGSAKFKYYDGGISQLIIYNTDQSSNRAGISSNINSFYSIY